MVRITLLVENTATRCGLLAEHGLAYWIEAGSHRILFDSGQGLALEHNAGRLRVDWRTTTAVALSHGHYDHTGGLERVLDHRPGVPVYAHPACLRTRYMKAASGPAREVGIPAAVRERLQSHDARWIDAKGPTTVAAPLRLTGEIPRLTEFEDTGGPFYLDAAGRQADPLEDDQALFFATPQGTVVLLGCAHAGVINTLRYVRQLTGDQPIHAVLGGMHLVRASEHRLRETFHALRELGVQQLAPGHCTGPAAAARLRQAFPDRYRDLSVGTQWEFATDDAPAR